MKVSKQLGSIMGGVALLALVAGCSQPGGGRYQQAGEATEIAADSTAPAGAGETYKPNDVSPVHMVADAPVSTFAVDVDTAAYANVRRFLNQGSVPR